MAITQKGTATEHGITFGYSDFFSAIYTDGDLKVSELVKYSWAAAEEPNLNAQGTTNLNMANSQGVAAAVQISYIQRGLEQPDYDYKFKYVNNRLPTSRPYSFTILVYAPNDDNITLSITSDNGNKFRLITDIDVQELYIRVREVRTATLTYQLPTAGTITQYQQYCYSKLYSNIDDGDMKIYAMNVFVIDEDTFFITNCAGSPAFSPYAEGYSTGGGLYCRTKTFVPSRQQSYTSMTIQEEVDSISNYQKSLWFLRWAGNEISDFLSETQSIRNSYNYYSYSDDIGLEFYCFDWDTVRWNMFMQTETSIYNILALNGLKCKFDTGDHQNDVLRPVIIDKMITGYTFDPDAATEFDDITNVTGNSISPLPPSPTPPGPEYDDDPWSGAAFSGVSVGGIGAFARCYYMTSTELQNLRSWMGSINVPEGFDPMAQIIGLSQVPVALSGDAAENICFINSSAVYDPGVTTRVVDSGVASQYAMGLPKKFSLGSVDIVRRMQERGEPYLDYSSQIELYLPLIGMFSLDTQTVMGRKIEAEAVLDPVSGTLAAYAWVSKDGQKLPIAYGSTTIGVDLPVTAQQYSVSKAALKQANAQLATSLLSSALTMVASATASGKAAAYSNGRATAASGMRNAREGFNSFTNAASIAASQTMVSQTGSVFGSFMDWGRSIRQLSYGNNTAISGSFGGSTAQWSYPFTAYIKIIRPRYEKPSNYAHTQGVPCVQAKTVGSCTGFIQCVGVDVSGITRATDIERQAIQAALSNGVYAGGGE